MFRTGTPSRVGHFPLRCHVAQEKVLPPKNFGTTGCPVTLCRATQPTPLHFLLSCFSFVCYYVSANCKCHVPRCTAWLCICCGLVHTHIWPHALALCTPWSLMHPALPRCTVVKLRPMHWCQKRSTCASSASTLGLLHRLRGLGERHVWGFNVGVFAKKSVRTAIGRNCGWS